MKVGWVKKPLGEVCTLQRGFDLPTHQRIAGSFPLISSSGIIDTHTDGPVKGPGIVTGRSGSVGKVFFIDQDFWPLNTTLYVRNFHGNDPRFIFYLLILLDLKSLAGGTGVPTLNRNDVHRKSVHIPLDIQEQQRIAAILDDAFDGIAKARANTEDSLKNARELFLSGYATAFTQSLCDGYKRVTVADMAMPVKGSMRTGPFGSQLLHSEFVDQGIAVLGIDNAVNNEFRWDKRRYITEEKYRQLSRYQVKPGDVLITIMGTCGRCAVVPDDIPVAINTKHLCCITLDPEKCSSGFLHGYFLYHPEAQQFLASRAQGSIMAGLNMGIISELPVLLPPLKQQHSLVSKITTLRAETQRLESIYQQKLAALDELKQSLLHQAFSGNL